MRTVTVSFRAKSINALLEQAAQENLILRSARGREFILAEIDDFDREVALTRQNKKLMAFLAHRARQTRTISFEEAKQQLGVNGPANVTRRRNSKRRNF